MRRLACAVLIVGLAAAVTACNDDESTPATTTVSGGTTATGAAGGPVIRYRFSGGSVDPDSARDVTLTIADGTANVVIDSNGEVRDDVSEPISDAAVATINESLERLEAPNADSLDCPGGTSYQLEWSSGDGASETISGGTCGTDGTEVLEAVMAALDPAFALFDMDALTDPSS